MNDGTYFRVSGSPLYPSSLRRMSHIDIWFGRNARGEAAEKDGRPDEAIDLYEANVNDGATTLYSYERLAVLYRNAGRLDDEVRVLAKAIALLVQKQRTDGRLDEVQAVQLRELRHRIEEARTLRERPKVRRRTATKGRRGCLGLLVLPLLVLRGGRKV